MLCCGLRVFEFFQLRYELLVVIVAVSSVVDSTMACGAQRDHVMRIVWATVADPSSVVHLKVGPSPGCLEGSRLVAAFAETVRSSPSVDPQCGAASARELLRHTSALLFVRPAHRQISKLVKGNRPVRITCGPEPRLRGFGLRSRVLDRGQLKDDRSPEVAARVGHVIFPVVAAADELAAVPETRPFLLEEVNVLARVGMF